MKVQKVHEPVVKLLRAQLAELEGRISTAQGKVQTATQELYDCERLWASCRAALGALGWKEPRK